jgi:hypothetical protein
MDCADLRGLGQRRLSEAKSARQRLEFQGSLKRLRESLGSSLREIASLAWFFLPSFLAAVVFLYLLYVLAVLLCS